MSEKLCYAIDQIRADRNLASYDEAMTKQAVILLLLAALGWDQFNPDEVRSEYVTGSKRVDYSLRVDGINKVFIEVKQTRTPLEVHEHQILQYAFQEGVKLAMLTNGVRWQFYLPLQEGSWTERRFCVVDLKQDDSTSIAENLTGFLSRANVESGAAVCKAEQMLSLQYRSRLLDAVIPRVWNETISRHHGSLVDILQQAVEKSCGIAAEDSEICNFLIEHHTQFTVAKQHEHAPEVSRSPHESLVPSANQYQGSTHRTDFKDECFVRLEGRMNRKFPTRINSRAYALDGRTGVWCSCSREYTRASHNYWFTLPQVDKRKLDEIAEAYILLGCGSVQNVVAIPLNELMQFLPRLPRGQKTTEQEGWDIYILNKQSKWLLLLKEPEAPIDITRYLL